MLYPLPTKANLTRHMSSLPHATSVTITATFSAALVNKISRARKAAASLGPVTIKLTADGRCATFTGEPDAVKLATDYLHRACKRRGYQTLAKSRVPGNEVEVLSKHPANPHNPEGGITYAPMLVRGHSPEAGRRWQAWANKTLTHL